MNRRERRRRKLPPQPATVRPAPATTVSDLLLQHAGQPAGGAAAVPPPDLAGLPGVAGGPGDALTAAFAAWRSERELDGRIAELRQALERRPNSLDLLIKLADLLLQARRTEAALAVYRQAAALAPERAEFAHLIAALGGAAAPPRAPAAYVANLFDGFADRFDEVLVHWLQYRGHEQVHAAVLRQLGTAAAKRNILDLGCGTGLAGTLFRPLARRLHGVDVSAGMLHHARTRGLYDQLVQADLTTFLDRTAERYDVILASDVLIYFGDLAPLFSRVARRLRSGGLFAATVEGHAGDGYRLQRTGRYSHAEGYLRSTAADCGLTVRDLDTAVIRQESQAPVGGFVFVLGAAP